MLCPQFVFVGTRFTSEYWNNFTAGSQLIPDPVRGPRPDPRDLCPFGPHMMPAKFEVWPRYYGFNNCSCMEGCVCGDLYATGFFWFDLQCTGLVSINCSG